jgi:hypothetical protein
MKKLLAILALSLTSTVFAQSSATIEYGAIDNVTPNSVDQNSRSLTARTHLSKSFVADVSMLQINSDATEAVAGSRIEAGLTGLYPTKHATFYTRVALGERYSTTTRIEYYSVEPGVRVPLGAGFTATAGYRFRSAVDTADNDTTRTARLGLNYALTKKDILGVRYDRVNGDFDQKIMNYNYTRLF